ncbi:MAG: SDR family oxidoreductase [Bacteroidota bacterium]|nr:SDR family oxidoreductase [Bacteroidota bacterium]
MSYAIITGASKGIGKAIAIELAKRKKNLLLIARTEQLLAELSEKLGKEYAVAAKYLAVDLSDPKAIEQILEYCLAQQLTIDVLINNAGYGLSGAFEQHTLNDQLQNMYVNMDVPVMLTYALLPQMKRNQQSFILNVCSGASYQAVPGLTVYAATKAFLLSFSRGLRYELRHTTVSVTAVCPGATDTDFPNRANVGAKAKKLAEKVNMKAEEVAVIAVNGMYARKAEVVPGFINQLGAFLVWLFPKALSERSAANIYGIK